MSEFCSDVSLKKKLNSKQTEVVRILNKQKLFLIRIIYHVTRLYDSVRNNFEIK